MGGVAVGGTVAGGVVDGVEGGAVVVSGPQPVMNSNKAAIITSGTRKAFLINYPP